MKWRRASVTMRCLAGPVEAGSGAMDGDGFEGRIGQYPLETDTVLLVSLLRATFFWLSAHPVARDSLRRYFLLPKDGGGCAGAMLYEICASPRSSGALVLGNSCGLRSGVSSTTMNHILKGRRALVTGGSRGIGAAIVKRLASEGAH